MNKTAIYKVISSILKTIFIVAGFVDTNSYAQSYYQDVEPIILSKCTPCHRPGEAAPFPLLTYNDISKRSNFIKKVITSGYMPPWTADNNYVHFSNDRSLTKKEIETVVNWIDNGVKKGKKSTTEISELYSITGYGRTPDLTLTALDTFTVKGNNKERFVEFKIPFELDQEQAIEGVEFFSNNKRLIHHANYSVQVISDSAIDIYQQPKFANHTDGNTIYTDPYRIFKRDMAYYGGWIPGSSAESYPEGIGWTMPKRGIILLSIHFSPTPIDEQSVNGIHLFFTKKPIKRKVTVVSFGSGGLGEKDIRPSFFMIPANQVRDYTLKFTNPAEDLSLLYIWPHMHYIGKSFKAYYTNNLGDTIPLVNIPKWDYRWQEMYRYKKFMKIPRGSTIHMECTYDNTEKNPFNPFNPPQNIYSYSNMQSDQEMMTMLLIYVPYKEDDEKLSTSPD